MFVQRHCFLRELHLVLNVSFVYSVLDMNVSYLKKIIKTDMTGIYTKLIYTLSAIQEDIKR